MAKDIRTSYTSASGEFPVKVFLHEKLVRSIVQNGFIMPIHVQINPTNKCNMDCDWCSCSERDRDLCLSYEEIMEMMVVCMSFGCEGVTITGGGEPLLHPDIERIVSELNVARIAMGLVTNGWTVNKLQDSEWDKITWARVSLGDGRKKEIESSKYWDRLARVSDRKVDLSFSYVLTSEPDYDLIGQMIRFANAHDITHVRLVTDILQRGSVKTLFDVKEWLRGKGIDDRLVIYQDRTVWTKGQKNCYISLLKPVIGADGKVYPCCGAQYRDMIPARNYSGCMGGLKDIREIVGDQRMFDGSRCEVCYYSNYNSLLGKMLLDIDHKEFV